MVVRCEGINISGNFYRNKCELGPGRWAGEAGSVWSSGFTDLGSRPPSGGTCKSEFLSRPSEVRSWRWKELLPGWGLLRPYTLSLLPSEIPGLSPQADEHQPLPWPLPLPSPQPHLLADSAR